MVSAINSKRTSRYEHGDKAMTGSQDARGKLAEYCDRRVTIAGMCDKITTTTRQGQECCVVLLQDVAVISPVQMDLGHVWIQYAQNIRDMGFTHGSRMQCSCRVRPYKVDTCEDNQGIVRRVTRYGLGWPQDIRVVAPCYTGSARRSHCEITGATAREGGTSPIRIQLDLHVRPGTATDVSSLQALVDLLRTFGEKQERGENNRS